MIKTLKVVTIILSDYLLSTKSKSVGK